MNGEQRITRTVERVNQTVRRYLTAHSDRLGVSDIEAHLLARLAARGPATVADIQRAFGLRASTLTNALDRLDHRGLVRREPHPSDRRTFLLSLTPAGTDAARHVVATVDALEARVAAQVTAEQLDGFHAVMAAIEQAAQAAADERRAADGSR
jgi:MarR family transcriptional regulator, organic hydroperoxide resistance regulator